MPIQRPRFCRKSWDFRDNYTGTVQVFLGPETVSRVSQRQVAACSASSSTVNRRYRATTDERRNRSVRVSCRLTLNGAGAAIDAAERGLGIVRPLSYQVETQIASGTLVSLLDEYEPKSIPVHLVFQSRPFRGGAQRAFIDHAVPLLRQSFSTDLLR